MNKTAIDRHRVTIMQMPVDPIRMQDLISSCDQSIRERKSLLLGMVNVAKLIQSRTNRQLYNSVAGADIIAADGQGVVILSRLMGQPLPERIAGIDVMNRLMELADRKEYRVFFLGAKPEIVQKVVHKSAVMFPQLQVAGYRDGYFDLDRQGQLVAEQIRDSRADILFVAITPPKKELFLDRWSDVMGVPVCHGVGGSFDVFAGRTKRAPAWMQKAGLEWLFRVMQEPRRMWKRYLITNTKFFVLSIGEIARARLGLMP